MQWILNFIHSPLFSIESTPRKVDDIKKFLPLLQKVKKQDQEVIVYFLIYK